MAPPVVLSPEERVALVRWAHRRRSGDARALRAGIVLAAADGRQDLEIGERFGVGRMTAARWRRRFLDYRLPGLERSLTRVPRRGRLPESRVREILQASMTPPGRYVRRTSSRNLAERFGLSHTTVRRLWLETGLRPPGYLTTPFRPDPVRPRGPRDVVGVYLRPPDHAIAFTLDPPASTSSLISPVPGAGATPSLPPSGPSFRVPGEGLLLREGAAPSGEQRARSFLRFLVELETATGRTRPVRVVVAGSGLEREATVRSWLVRRSHFLVEWVETPAYWIRRVAADLERLGRPEGASRLPRRLSETARAIGLFLSSYVGSREPFQWVASPGTIAADGAGGRLRYDLSVTGHPGFKKPLPIRTAMQSPPAPDPRAREMARVVLRKSLRVRRGEHVAIESWSETLDYANAFVLETLQLGARPLLFYQDEPTYWAAVAGARASDLSRIGDHLRAAIAHSDVLVTFFGPSDRERYHALLSPTRFRLGEYRDALYGAAAKAGIRAVQLALGRASIGSARMYGVDLARWRDELVEGTSVDPAMLHHRAQRVAQVLQRGRSIEIVHPNGTRLRLGLSRRRPQVSDGVVRPAHRGGDWSLVQLPAGVVSVALDERVADGLLLSNVPNSVGVFDAVGEVEGGRWTFTSGRLTRFHYDRGAELFAESYARGGAGKDRVGVLSVGLNPRISMAPLLVDQEAGTLTLQLGRNDTSGGTNHVAWWAWLLLRGADLRVDGTTIVKGGRLVE